VQTQLAYATVVMTPKNIQGMHINHYSLCRIEVKEDPQKQYSVVVVLEGSSHRGGERQSISFPAPLHFSTAAICVTTDTGMAPSAFIPVEEAIALAAQVNFQRHQDDPHYVYLVLTVFGEVRRARVDYSDVRYYFAP
jgi:hypothetical protein